jgi:hypothetical protein
MAHSHGCVSVFEEVAHRAPNNVTSAEDNRLLACWVDTASLEESHHGLGCAGNEEGVTASFGEFANVDRSESIDVLFVSHSGGDCVLRKVLG